jgi:hypothetical protein
MQDDFMKDLPEGVVIKSASVETVEVTPEDLRKINKYTLSPVKEEDVFVFKAAVGDNEPANDRNYEPFNLAALQDMKRLYPGKTVIKDHRRTADNQIARIYDAELVSEAKTTSGGEAFATLVVKCYMIRTKSNEDLISEIKGGIKREVSTSTIAKRAICSICGVDNVKTACPHFWGREYDGKTCFFTLDGVKDVHELSFVAVPAQRRAGTTKNYGGEQVKDAPAEPTPEETPAPDNDIEEKSIEARIRVAEALFSGHIDNE